MPFIINDMYQIRYLIYEDHPYFSEILEEQNSEGYVSDNLFKFKEWGNLSAMSEVDRVIMNMGTGIPGKPVDGYHEYNFPSDVTKLSLEDIGSLILKLAGWESYWLAELGRKSSDLILLRDSYDIGIFKYSEEKLTVKAVEYKATQENGDFKKAKQKIIELKALIVRMEKIIDGFHIQRDALSRELSRRELESKL